VHKDSLVYLVMLVCEAKAHVEAQIRVVTMLHDVRMSINDCVITIIFRQSLFRRKNRAHRDMPSSPDKVLCISGEAAETQTRCIAGRTSYTILAQICQRFGDSFHSSWLAIVSTIIPEFQLTG